MPGVVAVCLPAPKAEPPDPNPNPTRYVSDQCFDQEHGGGVQSTICMPGVRLGLVSKIVSKGERNEERERRGGSWGFIVVCLLVRACYYVHHPVSQG